MSRPERAQAAAKCARAEGRAVSARALGILGRARWSNLRSARGVLIQNARAFLALSTYMIDCLTRWYFSKCGGGKVNETEAG